MGIIFDNDNNSIDTSDGNPIKLNPYSGVNWIHGDVNAVTVTPDVNATIATGDLLWLDNGVCKPASDLTYSSSLQAMQELFHDAFLGVALEPSATSSTPIKVATTGIFEFPMATASVTIGSRLGIDDNDDGDALENQRVILTQSSVAETSIGRCMESVTSGESVKISIRTILFDGPQAIS